MTGGTSPCWAAKKPWLGSPPGEGRGRAIGASQSMLTILFVVVRSCWEDAQRMGRGEGWQSIFKMERVLQRNEYETWERWAQGQ